MSPAPSSLLTNANFLNLTEPPRPIPISIYLLDPFIFILPTWKLGPAATAVAELATGVAWAPNEIKPIRYPIFCPGWAALKGRWLLVGKEFSVRIQQSQRIKLKVE